MAQQQKDLPTAHQAQIQRTRAAELGLYEPLFEEVAARIGRKQGVQNLMPLLRQALLVRMRESPDECVLTTLKSLFATNAELALRAQAALNVDLIQHDHDKLHSENSLWQRTLVTQLMPIFQKITDELAELGLLISQISRQQELTRRLRLRNDLVERELHPERVSPEAQLQQKWAAYNDLSNIPRQPPPDNLSFGYDDEQEVDWGPAGELSPAEAETLRRLRSA